MTEYTEPTQEAFNSAEQVAIDVVKQAYPTITAKTGSAVRELVVRPIAYLLSWARQTLDTDRKETSVAYLKTSQLTENEKADLVASNYFVTRREGQPAKGIITLTQSSPVLRLSAGASFMAGDVQVQTTIQYIVTNTPADNAPDGIEYLASFLVGGNWLVNVPVETTTVGRIEIPVGTTVSASFPCSTLLEAELTSPITGGSDTETDAELMTRAEYNTAEAGIGTYYGIRKKLNKAPITVYGQSVVAGEDAPLFRSRYNNVNINPGGFVDCYVKTVNQPVKGTFDVKFTQGVDDNDNVVFTGVLKQNECAGFYNIESIIANGSVVQSFSYTFGTTDAGSTADGDRLSCNQTATITFQIDDVDSAKLDADDVESATLDAKVTVQYMPGIKELQTFLDGDDEKFIGQDVSCKAAVPVLIAIDCAVIAEEALSDDEVELLKQTITNYVNSLPVGTPSINFSDIATACSSVLPKAKLRLPCTFACSMLLKDGSTDFFYSNTGILTIKDTANYGYWDYKMCFFSTCTAKIRLGQI